MQVLLWGFGNPLWLNLHSMVRDAYQPFLVDSIDVDDIRGAQVPERSRTAVSLIRSACVSRPNIVPSHARNGGRDRPKCHSRILVQFTAIVMRVSSSCDFKYSPFPA